MVLPSREQKAIVSSLRIVFLRSHSLSIVGRALPFIVTLSFPPDSKPGSVVTDDGSPVKCHNPPMRPVGQPELQVWARLMRFH